MIETLTYEIVKILKIWQKAAQQNKSVWAIPNGFQRIGKLSRIKSRSSLKKIFMLQFCWRNAVGNSQKSKLFSLVIIGLWMDFKNQIQVKAVH